MAFKFKDLSEIRKVMNNRLEQVKDTYSTFTPLERAHFVQQAFYDVNDYCSRLWGYDKRDTAFGFMIGRNAGATAFCPSGTTSRSVGYSMLVAFAENDPYKAYERLFHEMKHIHQSRDLTPGCVLGSLFYPNSYQKNQTHARWLASPMETEADDFAIKTMHKVTKTGFLKSLFRAKPCKEESFYKGSRVKSFVAHLKGVGASVVENIKSIFGGPKLSQKEMVGKETNGGMRFFNLRDINLIINTLPYRVDNFSQLQNNPFREYLNEHNDLAHTFGGFFGVDRAFNQAMNKQGLQNGTKEFVTEENLENKNELAQNVEDLTQPQNINSNEVQEASTVQNVENEQGLENLSPEANQGNPALKDEIIGRIVADREGTQNNSQNEVVTQSEELAVQQSVVEQTATEVPILAPEQ